MGKLDPELEHLLHLREESRSLAVPSSGISPQAPDKLGILLAYTGDLAAIEALGFQAETVAGGIAAGSVSLDDLPAIAALDAVIFIELSRPLFPELDVSVSEIGAKAVHTGSPSYKGANVLIGVIDSGIDFWHRNFRYLDGKTRIISIWDQTTDGADGTPPTGYKYGVEYDQKRINDVLAETPGSSIAHRDARGHGTHVAGIAAGNGSAAGNCHPAGTYVGVAPEADLIVVKNLGALALGDSKELVSAIGYIFDKAAALPNSPPVVINLSQGDNIGAHDGTSLVEKYIDIVALSRPGRAVVKSAGNEGNKRHHAQGQVVRSAGSKVDVQFRVPTNQSRTDIFDLWYAGSDLFDITLAPPPPSSAEGPVSPGSSKTLTFANKNRAFIRSDVKYPFNQDNRIYFRIEPPAAGGTVEPGVWTITLHATTLADGHFHCWIERGSGTEFLPPFVSDECTITIPGTADSVITVGSYVNGGRQAGELSKFSGRGPTRDKPRSPPRKPDVMAPGEVVTSARSQWVGVNPPCLRCCWDQYHFRKPGTSMAAPHVAGVVALMLQKDPTLGAHQIRDRLRATARPTGTQPNKDWGWGKVEASQAMPPLTPPFPRRDSRGPLASADGVHRTRTMKSRKEARRFGRSEAGPWSRFSTVQKEVLQTRTGQRYAELVNQHLHEIHTLIETNRRVATVWHRAGGPRLVQLIIEAVYWPDRPLPRSIENRPVVEGLSKILSVLRRYGTPFLASDIDQHGPFLLALDGLSYNQFLERLGRDRSVAVRKPTPQQ